MKIKTLTILSALVLANSAVFSQNQLDAYKISQTDLNGTARYMGMGGAFGALGGDISAMHTNPAGLAVYRSSEVVTTLTLSSIATNTNWFGTTSDDKKTNFSFDNIAYVGYFPTSNDEGIVGWNVGFSYNRMKNFHRNYTTVGMGNERYSLADYMAVRADGFDYRDLEDTDNHYPYGNSGMDLMSVMAYNSKFIGLRNGPDQYRSNYNANDLTDRKLVVSEKGAIDQYNIAFGMNISNRVMLGANIGITDINYHYQSNYSEFYTNDGHLWYDNWKSTEGTGYNLNIGAIVQPIDYLRLGVAYNSPTWYKITDYIYSEGDNYDQDVHYNSESGMAPEYEFRSSDKWLFSAAVILGKSALISVDYELVNYKNMKLYDFDGNVREDQEITNEYIKSDFKAAGTLRVGAEVKVTPQFAVRAGAAWSQTSMKDQLKELDVEVYPVGMIPHFTTDRSITNYTVGFGYRFTPSFYMDLACILRSQKEDLYAYPRVFEQGYEIASTPSTLKTNTTRVALTVGYKF